MFKQPVSSSFALLSMLTISYHCCSHYSIFLFSDSFIKEKKILLVLLWLTVFSIYVFLDSIILELHSILMQLCVRSPCIDGVTATVSSCVSLEPYKDGCICEYYLTPMWRAMKMISVYQQLWPLMSVDLDWMCLVHVACSSGQWTECMTALRIRMIWVVRCNVL